MLTEEIEWLPDYAVGVAIIDRAHQDIFRMARRLLDLSHDRNRHQWVGEQGLKYLKNYAIRHFGEEEAYMRSISYPGFEAHRTQHLVMKEKILPRMESQLKHERYSDQAIEKFLRILQLWLARHIIVHDTAISR